MAEAWTYFLSEPGQTLTQNIIATLALIFAVRGVRTWRQERRDLRRAELAEQCLAVSYKARDAFEYVRSPFGYSSDGSSRKPEPDETPQLKQNRDTAYAPLERLNQFQDLFEQINSLRYNISAAFGPKAALPLDEFHWARNQIITAARMKYEMASYDSFSEDDRKERSSGRAILYQTLAPDKDPLLPRLTKAVADLETAFRPHVEATFRTPFFSRDFEGAESQ